MAESSFDVTPLAASLFGGVTCAIFLYGVSCAQVMYYFWHYTEDHIWLKYMIAALWFLDTLSSCWSTHVLWDYSLSRVCLTSVMGGPSYLAHCTFESSAENSLVAEFICVAAMVLLVQCNYAYTIWRVSTGYPYRILLTFTLVFLITGSCATGITNACIGWSVGIPGFSPMRERYPERSSITDAFFLGQMASASLADIMIVVLLCSIMYRQKTVFEGTTSMISKLKQLFIERGALTTMVQTLLIITYVGGMYSLSTLNPFSWLALHMVVGKLYVNSLLATLNARRYIRSIGVVANYVGTDERA